MSQRARFFDSSGGDRIYTSDAWAQVVQAIMGDGVAKGRGDELAVGESTPQAMSVDIETGSLFIQGRLFEVYSAAETLAIATSDPTNPRIDRVVVRLDPTARTAELAVLTGTPAASPSAPTLTQTPDGTWEISLAQVAVAALSGGVTNANITDERGYADGSATQKVLDTATGHRHDGSDSRLARHTDLASVGTDDHHAKGHTHNGDGSGWVPHSATTGRTTNDHHNQSHTHGSAADGTTLSPATLSPSGAVHLTGVITPTVGGGQNNWNPSGLSTASVIRANATGAGATRDISGIAAQSNGRLILLTNVGVAAVRLMHESGSSSAANRIIGPSFFFSGSYDHTNANIEPGESALLWYDGTSSRWRVLSGYE